MGKPTYRDAQLMIQVAQWWSTAGVNKAMNWIWSDEFIPEFDAFIEKYPTGSKGFARASLACSAMETLGTLYKHDLFSGELLFDWLAVSMPWNRLKGFALGMREMTGMARLYENFEALAEAEPD